MRRVVFAALLIRPRPRLSALGRGEPIVSVGRAHRAPAARRPVDMYRSSRWGAPRLRAAALSSLPACAPSPLAGRNLLPAFHAPAARPRPNALTLIPPGFVLPLVALAPPRFPICAGFPHPSLSLPCGASLRFAPTQTPALSLVGFATLRPRHASPRAGNMKRLLGAWCSRSPRGQTMRNVHSYHFMPCGICASRDDRTRAYYAEKRTHVRPLLFSGGYSATICEVCPR